MPALADCSPILLYSSAARFTSSMVGFRGPSRLGTIICVKPRSFAQAILPARSFRNSPMSKCELSHLTPQIAEHSAQLGPFVFGEAGEAGVGVTHRRAQFDRLKTDLGKLLDGAGKVLGDHIPDVIGLASDWHAQRIGAQLPCARRQDPGHRGPRRRILEKLSPRNCGHSASLAFDRSDACSASLRYCLTIHRQWK